MNIAISPVKIVQEEPFIFEAISGSLPTFGPATTSVSVARKIKFSDSSAVKAAEKETASADKNILATPLLTNGHAEEPSEIAKCSSGGSSEDKSSVATSDDEDVIESSQSSSNESADSKRQQRKRKVGNNSTTDGAADKTASVTKRTGDLQILTSFQGRSKFTKPFAFNIVPLKHVQ